MQGYIDRHEAGGIVTLIAREGKVVDVHASGFQDIESRKAMQTDTIFRIASMTKPITSVAAMMLEEEGKIFLTDPVSKYIPAFKGQRVVGEGGALVPARREITIRDLMSHRSGLSYGFLNGGPVGEAYRKEGVTDGLSITSLTLQEGIDKLAAQPLMAQPGSAWNYSLSTDTLGRVIEVASGMSLDKFFRDRIIVPLGMTDTSFDVPDAKWSRFATVYAPDGAGGLRPMKDPESFGNAQFSPFTSYKVAEEIFLGWSRPDVDDPGLRALRADAGEWRRTGRSPAAQSENDRADDGQPDLRPASLGPSRPRSLSLLLASGW